MYSLALNPMLVYSHISLFNSVSKFYFCVHYLFSKIEAIFWSLALLGCVIFLVGLQF